MIQVNHPTLQWQNELSNAIRDPAQLLKKLNLPLSLLPDLQAGHQLFPLRVTESYLSRIEPGNIHDPLLRQVLPLAAESAQSPDFSSDPVGDMQAETEPGLLHKYKNRVLLTVTAACGIHCRYCFRRHFNYSASNAIKHWHRNLAYIRNNTQINEVIFSGGDPLSITDHRLASMLKEISAIDHINTLRIHTRQVIVLPTRVDAALLSWTKKSRIKLIFVVHVNHPNEIDADVSQALKRLADAGITLLNQSVLLKGVNDSTETLKTLSNTLFANGVLPYYLHLLDKVLGAAHFEVQQSVATQLIQHLRIELPGYLIPKLVKDLPGTAHKTTIL